MGIRRTVARKVGEKAAPSMTAGWVRSALEKAIDGAGPVKPVKVAAEAQLAEVDGDRDKAVDAMIANHARWSGAQGFLTNLGGLATLPVSLPTNVSALAVLECHLVAGIAHLRGHDLDQPRVRDAVMACLLGEKAVKQLVKKGDLPARPRDLATAGAATSPADPAVAKAVATELVAQLTGGRTITLVARRVPLMGGPVGGLTDRRSTRTIGRYAAQELPRV